ncbi:MAG: hypothetical protein PUP91_27055 [Rhizonema sp. PD37]|nr:hypothetical protein [Rhizonema sp. PD37]
MKSILNIAEGCSTAFSDIDILNWCFLMSKLKISDLSFCETEFSSTNEVRGGLGLSLSSINGHLTFTISNPEAVDYYTNSYVNKNTGGTVYVVSDKDHKVVSGVESGKFVGGAYSIAFSRASV